jgi:LysM repeat protein
LYEDSVQYWANLPQIMFVLFRLSGGFHPLSSRQMCFLKAYLPPFFLLMLAITGCERPDPNFEEIDEEIVVTGVVAGNDDFAVTRGKITPPDPTRTPSNEVAPLLRPHNVAFGETLTYIASLYETTVEDLLAINDLESGDLLAAGQALMVPGGETVVSPSFKLIPDSELVYGPESAEFDIVSTINSYDGFLSTFSEEVEGEQLTGGETVQLVADRFSINPRLLLALLEYRSGWLTKRSVIDDGYPLGYINEEYEGLYQQLSWVANKVNLGFYGRSEGGLSYFDIDDDYRILFANDINDGTAGLQLLFASFPDATYEQWNHAIGPTGFYSIYSRIFGNPFLYTFDPLWPSNLKQPELSLPFTREDIWYFTGGPHGGWASGSAWAALDFTPSDGKANCGISQAWVLAVADGIISRSDRGAVILDLDGDGFSGTGWAVTYMHLATEDRVSKGAKVEAGDLLGHPSCEGGFSTATHLHIARTYNGRWVSADGDIPFIMDGWVSQGLGREYDGLLVRGDEVKEACQCEEEGNTISGE